MTPRERLLAVYKGQTPDQVPFMLDLSHWFYHKHKLLWDVSHAYIEPEYELIDYHKKMGVGFYIVNCGAFYDVSYPDDVKITTSKSSDSKEIIWKIETSLGTIQRSRRWEDKTYSWAISSWGIKSEHDLKVLGYSMRNRIFKSQWDRYQKWIDYLGDIGVAYVPVGYSGIGYLLNQWLGIEKTIYAITDWPETVKEVVDQINQSLLTLINVLAQSPAEIVFMGDNFSSDVQPPNFFNRWSKSFYTEAVAQLHKAGKYVAVHIDGRLRGSLKMISDIGVDCADAVTPKPMGDLTAEQCRAEGGNNFILSGGVSPDLWMPDADIRDFKKAAMEWLELKKISPRLIANAGDQVPPGASEERIEIMRDLVERFGRY